MVTVPAVTPVTTPPETVTFPLLALHTPPDTTSDKVIFAPVSTTEAPVIVPAVAEFTDTATVAIALHPKLLVPVTV